MLSVLFMFLNYDSNINLKVRFGDLTKNVMTDETRADINSDCLGFFDREIKTKVVI